MRSPAKTRFDWQPPFCPNSKCRYHNSLSGSWRYKRLGYYYRNALPHRIQRFQCLHCKRSFSSQTFRTSYWLKRPEILPRLFMKTIGGMANRQVARDLGCAPSTVDRQLARLGRHCFLFHWQQLLRCTPEGPIVVDGFESFEYSQYFPFHHNLAVEADSSFFLYFTDSELRRKGRMTDYQKQRREVLEQGLGRADPRAVERGMRELFEVVMRESSSAIIYSDDHRAYPRALRGQRCLVTHQVTSSRERRTTTNSLFEVNLLDLLIRHSSANHRRETIAWSKRRQCSSERLAILLVWRNYVKRRWEKGEPRSPAMAKGLFDRLLSPPEILVERLFRSRVKLPRCWSDYYERMVETRALPSNRRHSLHYAF